MSANDWPPKFTLDGQQILTLLTGDRFYSSADAAIREAVLNSIDACGRREVVESAYTPSIEVVFDNQSRTLTVTDNGDGMGEEEISSLFAKVGASASRLVTKAGEGQYKAIGEFGIGVVSYFLVCDRFQVHTLKVGRNPVGLEFSKLMLDTTTPATDIQPQRDTIGTTLILFVQNDSLFQLLRSKYPHWMRDVKGLTAKNMPENTPIPQGGRTVNIRPVSVETPPWVEKAELGPPVKIDVWKALDGLAHIDVLYRGVFVQPLQVQGLWGIQGALHVDPKQFRPRLNRESFIAEGFSEEMTRFLQTIHPQILMAALQSMRETFSGDDDVAGWTFHKWVTLWLAVPRSGAYAEVAKAWDEELRKRKAFRLLREDSEILVSLEEIQSISAPEIYIAPPSLEAASVLVKQAVKVLRAKRKPVIQGILRESGYLSQANMLASSSAELLSNYFRSGLPNLVSVDSIAQKVISEEETVEVLFTTPPKVVLVRLGAGAAALVNVGGEIWINVESTIGKQVIQEVCDRNEGHLGLLVACQKHAQHHMTDVAAHLRGLLEPPERLGPVRRQYLRKVTG